MCKCLKRQNTWQLSLWPTLPHKNVWSSAHTVVDVFDFFKQSFRGLHLEMAPLWSTRRKCPAEKHYLKQSWWCCQLFFFLGTFIKNDWALWHWNKLFTTVSSHWGRGSGALWTPGPTVSVHWSIHGWNEWELRAEWRELILAFVLPVHLDAHANMHAQKNTIELSLQVCFRWSVYTCVCVCWSIGTYVNTFVLAKYFKHKHQQRVESGTSKKWIYNQLDKSSFQSVSIKHPLSHLDTGHHAVLGKDAGGHTVNTNRQSCWGKTRREVGCSEARWYRYRTPRSVTRATSSRRRGKKSMMRTVMMSQTPVLLIIVRHWQAHRHRR